MDEEKDTRKVEEKPIGNGTPEESRKRKRRRENLPTLVPKFGMAAFDTEDYIEWDEDLMSYRVPEEMEKIFAVAVFEIGLKHSTPKTIMDLMFTPPSLKRVHVKSHLQKARTDVQRSKAEFNKLWTDLLAEKFAAFQDSQKWRCVRPTLHKVVKKQLLAAREIEKYKGQLKEYVKAHTEIQESMKQISSKEVELLKEMWATLNKVAGDCNDLV